MKTIVDTRYGKSGYGWLVYPVNMVIWTCMTSLKAYLIALSVAEEDSRYALTATLVIGLIFCIWMLLGSLRGTFQCFLVIQEAKLGESRIEIKTFSQSKNILKASDVSSIVSFSLKPAICLFSSRHANYLITLVNGHRYAISAGVKGAVDFLEEIHRINSAIEFSLEDGSLRSHWTLKRI